jgi:hypothetical protein
MQQSGYTQRQRPLLRTNLDNTQQYLYQDIFNHVQQQFTPGYVPPSAPQSYIASSSFPNTAVPSLAEDGFTISSPIEVRDLMGGNRSGVQFECDSESYTATRQLTTLVNEHRYTVQNTTTTGPDSVIEALQKSMSFTLRGLTPPTMGQIRVDLRSQFDDRVMHHVTANHLALLLDQYERQSGMALQLGIVTPGTLDRCYRVTLHKFVPFDVPTLWLYHSPPDLGSDERWSAITPQVVQVMPSYADAVRARPPPQQSRQSPAVDTSRLHPSAALIVPLNNQRTTTHLNSSTRANSSRGPRQAGPSNAIRRGRPYGHGRRSSQASRATSLTRISEGDRAHQHTGEQRPHKCPYPPCEATFLYPKDLNRHIPHHTKAKASVCNQCGKTFTRDDNMKRHMASAHSNSRS